MTTAGSPYLNLRCRTIAEVAAAIRERRRHGPRLQPAGTVRRYRAVSDMLRLIRALGAGLGFGALIVVMLFGASVLGAERRDCRVPATVTIDGQEVIIWVDRCDGKHDGPPPVETKKASSS